MIDLHSHILPGIDDGARTMSDALAMAEQSIQAGVTHLLCTPHMHQGVYDNSFGSIEPVFIQFVDALQQHAISLKVAYAAEIRIKPEITAWVQQNQIPFIGTWQQKPALLLELPHSHIPAGTDILIRWLLKNNIQAVIPHPERNREIQQDYTKATMLKRLGCVFQATAGAFTGSFGQTVYDTAIYLLEAQSIDYIASDTHSVNRRPNEMDAAAKELRVLLGKEQAEALTLTTPWQISQHLTWCN